MTTNGVPSPVVTLVSSDGFEFHVRRSAACVSPTLRRMLDTQSTSSYPLSSDLFSISLSPPILILRTMLT